MGYLFPMAPWFAFAHWIGHARCGSSQRLWLGALIAVAAWGVVRLLDELYSRRRGVAHLAAGVLYAANPYVAVWTTPGSAALLAYAARPVAALAAASRDAPAAELALACPDRPRARAQRRRRQRRRGCSGSCPRPLALMLYEAAVAGRGGRRYWPSAGAPGCAPRWAPRGGRCRS